MRISSKETILRKSEYQQKVLKFKKTSPLSQNLFIESNELMDESIVKRLIKPFKKLQTNSLGKALKP